VTGRAPLTASGEFREPFVGHLPGYLAQCQVTGAARPSEEAYNELLMARWRSLLDSPESRVEGLVHAFLERHPSLLPGSHSVDGDSGHPPFPMAVISKPKLAGLSDREPDFMWIATDSGSVYPILIEIETPHKEWFYGDHAEIRKELTHAQGQLAEWRAWFNRGQNRSAFLEQYEVPQLLAQRRMSPRYVLIYGRRADYQGIRRREEKRAELARQDERLMSFDRLTPAKNSILYSCVKKTQDGYSVVAIPPCLTIFNTGDPYSAATGWEEALDNCPDMADERRNYLKREFGVLRENPDAYVRSVGGMSVRRPSWL
jgi:Domain of unknown function (DUF4263)